MKTARKRMQHSGTSRMRGFTLVEVLVAMVIAMIIILMTTFAWQNATRVVRRTEAMLYANYKAADLMLSLLHQTQEVAGACPFIANNDFNRKQGHHLAFIFSDREYSPGTGGTSYVKDPLVLNEDGKPQEAIWGVGSYDERHPYFDPADPLYAESWGKKVMREYFFSAPIGTLASVYRLTNSIQETGPGTYRTTHEVWQPNTEYHFGDVRMPSGNNITRDQIQYAYRVINRRTGNLSEKFRSAPSAPAWPTRYGEVVQDGEVLWQCIAPILYNAPTGKVDFSKEYYSNWNHLTRGSIHNPDNYIRASDSRIGPIPIDLGARGFNPYTVGVGYLDISYADNSDTDGMTWANRIASFDGGNVYRNLDNSGGNPGRPNDKHEMWGFSGNDPRGGEPPYHPRWMKYRFNAIEIPRGSVNESYVQDFVLRVWLR